MDSSSRAAVASFTLKLPPRSKLLALLLLIGAVGACSSQAQSSTNVPGLVSLWAAEGNAMDSASTNRGSIQGSVGFALGQVGAAFSFDGTGGYVEIPYSPTLQLLSESTLVAWINLDRLPSQVGTLYVAGRSQPGNDFDLQVDTDDRVRYYPCGGAGGLGYPGSVTTLKTGVWYQVAATYKAGRQMELFLNGAPEVSIPLGCTLGANSSPFTIGWSPIWGRPFYGRIDQVRLFDRALRAEEVQNLYAIETGGSGSPWLRVRVSAVELCWDTEPGASYSLQYSTALAPGVWVPISTYPIQGAGTPFCTNDVVLPGQPIRYYRLVVTNQLQFP